MALHDSTKTAPLMLAGLIVGGYSFYAVFVGTANGLREFHKQAGLDITFATLRVAGLLGMAMAGFGVVGVIGGWVAAVGVILCAAIAWVGLPRSATETAAGRPMIGYFVGVAIYLALFNALMFVDSLLLKRLTTEYFAAHAARSRRRGRSRRAVGAARGRLPRRSERARRRPERVLRARSRTSRGCRTRRSSRRRSSCSRWCRARRSPTTRTPRAATSRSRMRYSLMFAMAIAVVMAANPVDVLGLRLRARLRRARRSRARAARDRQRRVLACSRSPARS